MKVKKESETVVLKLKIQKTKIMASGPISSWQIDEGTVETVSDFIFLGPKITAASDCSKEIKRCLSLGRKAMTNLMKVKVKITQSWLILCESKDMTLLMKVCIVKTMVFLVVMYECESWPIKKAERQRNDTFELWCWK